MYYEPKCQEAGGSQAGFDPKKYSAAGSQEPAVECFREKLEALSLACRLTVRGNPRFREATRGTCRGDIVSPTFYISGCSACLITRIRDRLHGLNSSNLPPLYAPYVARVPVAGMTCAEPG